MKKIIAAQIASLLLLSATSASAQLLSQSDFRRESQEVDKYIKEEHWDAAKRILQHLTRIPYARDHEFCQLAYCYISAFASKEDYAAADRCAARAIAYNPENGHAMVARAICAVESYHYDFAVELASRALTCKQADPFGHFIRARAYIQEQRYDDAIVDLEAWNVIISKINKMQTCNQTEAEVYEKMGKLDEAVKHYRLDREVHPEQSIKNAVRCLRKQKKYTEAISEATLLIKRNVDDCDAYNLRAAIRAENHDWKGAIADYDHAINLSPTPTYYKNRAHAYEELGEIGLAKKDLAEAEKTPF